MSLNEEHLWFEKARSMQFFFHRQIWHLLAFVVLVPVTWVFAALVMGDRIVYWVSGGVDRGDISTCGDLGALLLH